MHKTNPECLGVAFVSEFSDRVLLLSSIINYLLNSTKQDNFWESSYPRKPNQSDTLPTIEAARIQN